MTSQRVPENYKPCVIMAERLMLPCIGLSVWKWIASYTINLSSVFKYFSVDK